MTILYFIVATHLDGEVTSTRHFNEFKDPVEAEDIMHSMQKGVFDDDYVFYIPDRIVYELEEGEV